MNSPRLFLFTSILATGIGLIFYESIVEAVVLGIAVSLGATMAIAASKKNDFA
jgi:hypothetical protein